MNSDTKNILNQLDLGDYLDIVRLKKMGIFRPLTEFPKGEETGITSNLVKEVAIRGPRVQFLPESSLAYNRLSPILHSQGTASYTHREASSGTLQATSHTPSIESYNDNDGASYHPPL